MSLQMKFDGIKMMLVNLYPNPVSLGDFVDLKEYSKRCIKKPWGPSQGSLSFFTNRYG